jgi:hypothetical protein
MITLQQEQDHPHSTMTELQPQLMPKIVIGSDGSISFSHILQQTLEGINST